MANKNNNDPAAEHSAAALAAALACREADPFALRGMHHDGPDGVLLVRCFVPGADHVAVLERAGGRCVAVLQRLHPDGYFAGTLGRRKQPFVYVLRVDRGGQRDVIEDAYRFGSTFGPLDLHLLAQGDHLRSFEKLGAHRLQFDDIAGVRFAVWAPHAGQVSVIGEFNQWDPRVHPMRRHPDCGVWEIFVPGVAPGMLYKFALFDPDGKRLPLKADPYAFYAEQPPGTASRVFDVSGFRWSDEEWMAARADRARRSSPVSIYEVHLGSWRRHPGAGKGYYGYRELAEHLVPYVKSLGFTHLELLPVQEYPFDGSWGYQPTGLFAPTSRFGTPEDFRFFVDTCHREGLGLLLDWVPAHFPSDEHALAHFDGTHLYEYGDPRKGYHQDWNTLIYNFGRLEVRNFLIANALFWLNHYHLDGLRVDAVASMLYLNYSRQDGEWVPNVHGGSENLEAIELIKRLNAAVAHEASGAVTIAEESTTWPGVSAPLEWGGLGFGYKWNLGWMHDTLDYMSQDPVHRGHHHNKITFGLTYAYSENFILPFSHDEVVHGKRSLLEKMPGDEWQKFANLRACLGYMWGHPGKKLLFMGGELAQRREWNHDWELDWGLLAQPAHAGVQRLVADLNRLYRSQPALHQRDCEPAGFRWVQVDDAANSVFAFLRSDADGDFVLVVSNFTPVPRDGYRIGVPAAGRYRAVLNSDHERYWGSGYPTGEAIATEPRACGGFPHTLALNLPPLATVFFKLKD